VTQFWSDVLSGLISTAAGVILGIPGGLWLNRKAQHAADQAAEDERDRRALIALSAARDAVVNNVKILNDQIGFLRKREAVLAPPFQTATWDALSAEVLAYVESAEVRRLLAEHFAGVSRWVHLHDMFVSYCVGELCNYSTAREMTPKLITILVRRGGDIVSEADVLIARLREKWKNL